MNNKIKESHIEELEYLFKKETNPNVLRFIKKQIESDKLDYLFQSTIKPNNNPQNNSKTSKKR
ncbi:MAG: hypothetical protein VZS44_05180 [Bacilli bacterium]|nr:hypothetical protein [Bacilli bacterium]